MKTTVWDIFAPVYERSMRSQKDIYDYMYNRISQVVAEKEVLELATGPGMIAKHIAASAKNVIATDFSQNMIATAMKGDVPRNVYFEVADATDLRFKDHSFDVVIIANALHVMPNPEKALAETERVLKPDGTLIAPNFIFNGRKNLWQRFLTLIGIRFANEWTAGQFSSFLQSNGWEIEKSEILKGRIDLLYTECKRA